MEASEEVARKRAVVVGLGVSGVAAARKLVEIGAGVTAFDNADSDAVRDAASELAAVGIETRIGELESADAAGVDLVVVSPGVPPDSPSVVAAREAGAEVISELELAYRLCGGTIVAITGTNGKTTTATLTGELFKAAGRDTVVAGNIAPAFISALKPNDTDTVYVIEASSFQLATASTFRPRVAAVLNITPDHLNWHGTMDEYIQSKARIFANQSPEDFAVLNFDDDRVRGLAGELRSRVLPFSRAELAAGVCVVDGGVVERADGETRRILDVGALQIRGAHNVENALAAVGIARCCGVEIADIARALSAFEGVEHRLEKVQVVDGVTYWNDSKATNPDATIKALEAFEGPIIVLLGGRNKGNSFDEVAALAATRAKLAIAFGEAGPEIADSLEGADVAHETVSTMAEAVVMAAERSKAGDDVVLSPACASFDEFDNFGQRGRIFKDMVASIGSGES